MQFYITVKSGYRKFKLLVEQIEINERTERYKISSKKSFIVVESNRPFFRNRGLKHRRPDWKIIEGKAYHGNTFNEALEAILKVIDK